MSLSQNCAFTARVDNDAEFEHPAGATLARFIARELKAAGWITSDIDNWRDCGWSVYCHQKEQKLEVVLAPLPEEDRWILQVFPQFVAGIIARLFRRVSSASRADVLSLAEEVDRVLTKSERVQFRLWCWDGFPKPGIGTGQPE